MEIHISRHIDYWPWRKSALSECLSSLILINTFNRNILLLYHIQSFNFPFAFWSLNLYSSMLRRILYQFLEGKFNNYVDIFYILTVDQMNTCHVKVKPTENYNPTVQFPSMALYNFSWLVVLICWTTTLWSRFTLTTLMVLFLSIAGNWMLLLLCVCWTWK